MITTSIDLLQEQYALIHACHICPQMDGDKMLRRIDAIDPRTDIVMVSQSLAEGQLRKTGVNYFSPRGRLGNSGSIIERFVNKFNRTVYPPIPIDLSNGVIIPACKKEMIPIYNTEIIHCFPGKREKGGGDRKPDRNEIAECLGRGFLRQELRLIKPKLIILHGALSRQTFFRYFVNEHIPQRLEEHIHQILKSGKLPTYAVDSLEVKILPMMHAASHGRPIWDFIENENIIEIVSKALL